MKALAIRIVLAFVIISCTPLFAQGTFYFSNFVQSEVNAPVFDARGNPLEGANYLAALWTGGTSDSLRPVASSTTPFQIGTLAGYFLGSVVTTPIPPGALASLQVRAWDARLGGTYEEVARLGIGGYGESNIIRALAGNPDGGVPTLPGSLIGLQSFSLRPIPEPSPTLLFLLGLPWLLWHCWRAK